MCYFTTLSNGLSGINQAIQVSGKWHGVKIHTLDIYTTLGGKYLVSYLPKN